MVRDSSVGSDRDGDHDIDMVLIGGGIMSATLGAMLALLEPDWRIVLLERADDIATESSDPWNNAGTGHSGFCELNYMPDPADRTKTAEAASQFHLTRQWWAHLIRQGLLDPDTFVHSSPHMSIVFGDHDVAYLRQRFQTLSVDPLFAELEYSEDPAVIRQWMPLVMKGRSDSEPIAATRHPGGLDVDFGALTRGLTRIVTDAGGELRLGHDVRSLRRVKNGGWVVAGRNRSEPFEIRTGRVFVGAGGYALRLLQSARLPEVSGYAVLPVGAAFLRCKAPDVVARHDGKVYGQAAIGAPPMSVPHLDKRVVDDTGYLLFGPYATLSTKLLKHGRVTDLLRTLRWRNLPVLTAAILQNLALVRYLITELAAGQRRRFAQLQRLYPEADPEQWEFIAAGQRAQLVTPDKRRVGMLQQGTELVTSSDGTLAGLLGASPGASTAVPIMLGHLRLGFPEHWHTSWHSALTEAVPGLAANDLSS